MDSCYLFVYGTLRRGSTHPLSQTLEATAHWRGKATINGILYRISWYPGLILSNNPEDQVIGDIFEMDPQSKLMDELDAFEAYDPSKPLDTQEYRRETHPVLPDMGGNPLPAWVYLYNQTVEHYPIITSGDFLQA